MSTLRFQEVELSKFPRPCGHFCQVEFVPVSAGSVGRTVDTVAFRCMTSSSILAILSNSKISGSFFGSNTKSHSIKFIDELQDTDIGTTLAASTALHPVCR